MSLFTIRCVLNILSMILVIGSVSVSCQDDGKDPPCKQPRALACPELVCNLLNSRNTDFCVEIECDGLVPENCKGGSVYERGLTMCGCCGGCAKYIGIGEPCDVSPPEPSVNPNCTDPYCPILMNACTPGLVCNYLGGSSKVCAVDITNPPPETESSDCEDKRTLGLIEQLHYTPTCLTDGTYAPKQCKGRPDEEGVCFCADPFGKRIFGREWRARSENQTCECSRHANDLRREGNIAAIHCSPDGNYEPLQCDFDSKVCYCVDEQTGRLNGAILPEDQWKLLPCYSSNLTNGDPTGRYLRVCESEWVAGQRLSKQAIFHGLHVLSVKDYDCEYDGSFAPLNRLGDPALSYCVSKEGGLTAHFQMIDSLPMDCQCYRDSILYMNEGRNFIKLCSNSTGNYATTSPYIDSIDTYSCVDSDGFYFGNLTQQRYHCCLLGDCSGASEDVRRECYNPVTGTGRFRSCSLWQQ